MRCHPTTVAIVFLCIAAALGGCAPQQPYYFRNNADLSHYVGVAATIDNVNVNDPPDSEIEGTQRPFSITQPAPKQMWDLTLEETIKIALQNAKVIRSLGGAVQGPPAFLTANPTAATTIYDPAIVETDARFGIAAGESLFDPTWTTDMFWERNHEPRNVNEGFAGSLPLELNQDAFQFQTGVSKTTADGTVLSVSNSTVYDLERNDPTRQTPSDWEESFQMEIRKPLLQGAGVEFNQIAGPGAVPGFNQGVLLARLNSDIALTVFEGAVRNMVADVESTYWELYFAYRNLDTAVEGRDDSLRTWQKAHSKYVTGAEGGDAAYESQALEQYWGFKVTAEQAQVQLYHTESRLRFLLGIPATDGRLIRPKDDPTTARIDFDWDDCLNEALARSVEIREARQRVKQRELELIAAKNWLLPNVSLDARYRWDGMGNHFLDPGDSNFSGGAVDNLGSGQYQSWHLGVDASVPIGFRKQASGVTSAEEALSRDRAKLHDTELEVVNQLTYVVSDLEADYQTTVTNFNRRAAAERNLRDVQAAYDLNKDVVPYDVLLQAQRTLASAESDYFRSLTNYAKAISQVHRIKGSLLEYNGVFLAEGPWPAKAYFDARRRARACAAAVNIDYGFTYPRPVSRGEYKQFSGQPMGAEETPATAPGQLQPPPANQKPELLPTPPSSPGPSVEQSLLPAPGPAAPRDAAPPSGAAVVASPGNASRDLGAMDLSGLATTRQPTSAEPGRLDMSGFAPMRPVVARDRSRRGGAAGGILRNRIGLFWVAHPEIQAKGVFAGIPRPSLEAQSVPPNCCSAYLVTGH